MSRRTALLALIALGVAVPLLLACTVGVSVNRAPRWACPSPTPQPWGTAGPVKDVIHHTRPITEGGDWDEPVYFQEWEQEYADRGGPPFPSPTPFALVGTSYVFGQRVEAWPLHVQVTASAGPVISDTQQLYRVRITWVNHSLDPIPIDYAAQVRLRGITTPAGALISDGRWGVTAASLIADSLDALPDTIPPGDSQVVVPIIGLPGAPETVEIAFQADTGFQPLLATATTLAGTPTPTPVPTLTPTTSTANADLRDISPSELLVQWSDAAWVPPGSSPCANPGALTDWSTDPGMAWGAELPLAVAAPPGANRVVQIALNQVGKRYIWGAKGPETFDCSGLVSWAYSQIGIRIPLGTAGQWPGLTPADQAALQPGDLVYFAIAGGRVDHVGMLLGDLDGDGQWDMVHAASPALGVRIDYGIFASAYYRPRIVGFRTAR